MLVFWSPWEWCWWCWSAAQCCDVNLIEEADHQNSWDSCEMPAAHQWRVVNAKPSPNWASPGQARAGHPNWAWVSQLCPCPCPHTNIKLKLGKYYTYTGHPSWAWASQFICPCSCPRTNISLYLKVASQSCPSICSNTTWSKCWGC